MQDRGQVTCPRSHGLPPGNPCTTPTPSGTEEAPAEWGAEGPASWQVPGYGHVTLHFLFADLLNSRKKNSAVISSVQPFTYKKCNSHPLCSQPRREAAQATGKHRSKPLSKPQISEASSHLRFISFFRIVLPRAIVCRSGRQLRRSSAELRRKGRR